ncbi:hypothetical protein BDV12DRAFT_168844 [Aspergillus spectabilis]
MNSRWTEGVKTEVTFSLHLRIEVGIGIGIDTGVFVFICFLSSCYPRFPLHSNCLTFNPPISLFFVFRCIIKPCLLLVLVLVLLESVAIIIRQANNSFNLITIQRVCNPIMVYVWYWAIEYWAIEIYATIFINLLYRF